MSRETCQICDAETGRAGAGEDSVFFERVVVPGDAYHNDIGPLCDSCEEDHFICRSTGEAIHKNDLARMVDLAERGAP